MFPCVLLLGWGGTQGVTSEGASERISLSMLLTSAELRVLLGLFSVPQVRGYRLDIKVCVCVPSVYSRCVLGCN